MDDLIYIDQASIQGLPYVSTNSCARRVSFVSLKRIDFVLRQDNSFLFNFGEKTHEAGVFDRHGELTLILGAGAGAGTRGDFSIRGDEAAKEFHILIVDVFDVVLLEVADFPPRMHFLECHC